MRFWHEFFRIVMPLVVLAVGAGICVRLIVGKKAPEEKEVRAKTLAVETVPVEKHDSGLLIPVDGVVVPYREIAIAAEVSGVVEKKSLDCRAGKYVSKGDLLIQIEQDYYQKELEILEKGYDQAQRAIAELDIEKENLAKLIANAEAQAQIEEDQEERYRHIRENSARLLTEREYDLQQLALLGVQNQLITLRNQETMAGTKRLRLERAMEEMQLRIDRAKLDLERTTIAAPISGMIIADLCEEDGYVAKGTVVAKIEDVSKVEVRCNLEMDEMYWVWRQPAETRDPSDYYRIPQTPVRVIYRLEGKELVWKGVLARYDGIGVDETTRTVPCRVVIDNPRSEISGVKESRPTWSGPPALVRGMYVTVEIETKPEDALLQIPELALKPNGTVWIVRDGTLHIQSVNVVEIQEGKVVLTRDGDERAVLQPGDRVVVSPLPGAYDGMPVADASIEPPEEQSGKKAGANRSPAASDGKRTGSTSGGRK